MLISNPIFAPPPTLILMFSKSESFLAEIFEPSDSLIEKNVKCSTNLAAHFFTISLGLRLTQVSKPRISVGDKTKDEVSPKM